MSRTAPFLIALLRKMPSSTKPAFSNTRREAALSLNGSAYTRNRSVLVNANAQAALTACVATPLPQYSSAT